VTKGWLAAPNTTYKWKPTWHKHDSGSPVNHALYVGW